MIEMLSREAILEIRNSVNNKSFTLKKYADKFGVTELAIRRIVNNQSHNDPAYKNPRINWKKKCPLDLQFCVDMRRNRHFTYSEICTLEQQFTRRPQCFSPTHIRDKVNEYLEKK